MRFLIPLIYAIVLSPAAFAANPKLVERMDYPGQQGSSSGYSYGRGGGGPPPVQGLGAVIGATGAQINPYDQRETANVQHHHIVIGHDPQNQNYITAPISSGFRDVHAGPSEPANQYHPDLRNHVSLGPPVPVPYHVATTRHQYVSPEGVAQLTGRIRDQAGNQVTHWQGAQQDAANRIAQHTADHQAATQQAAQTAQQLQAARQAVPPNPQAIMQANLNHNMVQSRIRTAQQGYTQAQTDHQAASTNLYHAQSMHQYTQQLHDNANANVPGGR